MKQQFNHINITRPPETTHYTSTKSFSSRNKFKERNRAYHGRKLRLALSSAKKKIDDFYVHHEITRQGCYLEFLGEEGFDFATKSLQSLQSKNHYSQIRIVSQKDTDSGKIAIVYVPLSKIDFYYDKINSFVEEETKKGRPKNEKLINNLKDIREALFIESLWQDPPELLPNTERKWCEAWLSCTKKNSQKNFEKLLIRRNIPYKKEFIDFHERSVKLIYANRNELSQIVQESDDVAEFRIAKVTASFWTMQNDNTEQAVWAKNLLDRLEVDKETNTSICILDTGVNNGHILLNPLLQNADCLSVDPSWGSYDHDGHGTKMAGLSGYGYLTEVLLSSNPIRQSHILESIKILPPGSGNLPELWGAITSQAVSISEISKPLRNRIFCMAITSSDTIDKGRPSSWSGAIDQITSGAMEDETPKRLIIVSSGNVNDFTVGSIHYPNQQIAESSHDPAQAWNALTVGAYTELSDIIDPSYIGFECVAPRGSISPFTTTSLMWEKKWPFKPDVVFEGGNIAFDKSTSFADPDCNDLALLTTNHEPSTSIFCHMNQTSASTALASNFAAKIQAKYPEFWPETIRGLIVHSANWSNTMLRQFAPRKAKTSMYNLLRICGYGIPNLERAMYSAENRLTMVAQKTIQPFEKKNYRSVSKEMHLYELPWPKIVLQNLPDNIEIMMRVTLSYFIEPSPGEVGWENKYRYPSFNLAFLLNSPGETKEQFAKRINKEFQEKDEAIFTNSPSDHWEIGEKNRQRGSIHSDIWKGTPQELASSNILAIVPRTGWWKERPQLGKVNSKARYSLIVSINSPEENIDIYTPVRIIVENQVPIQITT